MTGDVDIPEVPVIRGGLHVKANDIFDLAARCPAQMRPNLYFDCGRDDILYRENEHFARYLRQLKFPHTYRRYPGVHDWDYWDVHIQDALKFVAHSMSV